MANLAAALKEPSPDGSRGPVVAALAVLGALAVDAGGREAALATGVVPAAVRLLRALDSDLVCPAASLSTVPLGHPLRMHPPPLPATALFVLNTPGAGPSAACSAPPCPALPCPALPCFALCPAQHIRAAFPGIAWLS